MNQTQSRTQLAEAQKAQGTGNIHQEGGTLPDSEITWPNPIPTQGTNEKGKTEGKAKTGNQNQYQTNDQAKHFNVDDKQFDMPQELEMSLYNRTEDEALYSEELGQAERKKIEINHITMLRE